MDKHAVFGVLSGTDCFRVKVQRVTRDGRYVDGNFPNGARALHYGKVILEPHLTSLTRAGVEEYCRIRQRDMVNRECEKEIESNELRAVRDAKTAVASEGLGGGVNQGGSGPEILEPVAVLDLSPECRQEPKLKPMRPPRE